MSDSPRYCPRRTLPVAGVSFGLESGRGLVRLGAMGHVLDIGEGFVPEASGFEAMLAGARQCAKDNDHLLAAVGIVLATEPDRYLLHQSRRLRFWFRPRHRSLPVWRCRHGTPLAER